MSHNHDISSISGNAQPDVKNTLVAALDPKARFNDGIRFAQSVGHRLKITEASVNQKLDEPQKLEVRVVVETTVEEDMLNGGGYLHGACSAYLVDVCSSLPLLALTQVTQGEPLLGVTSTINMVYHSPAVLGDKLRIVNTSMTVGSRAMSARTEIWNGTYHRLVSSGVHLKMHPSLPKSKM